MAKAQLDELDLQLIETLSSDARVSNRKIAAELGWEPSLTLDEGLRHTVQWYLDNEAWWRPLQERQGVGQRLGTAKTAKAGAA